MDSPSKDLKVLPLINHSNLAPELVWRSLLDLEIVSARCAASIARVMLAAAAPSPPLSPHITSKI